MTGNDAMMQLIAYITKDRMTKNPNDDIDSTNREDR